MLFGRGENNSRTPCHSACTCMPFSLQSCMLTAQTCDYFDSPHHLETWCQPAARCKPVKSCFPTVCFPFAVAMQRFWLPMDANELHEERNRLGLVNLWKESMSTLPIGNRQHSRYPKVNNAESGGSSRVWSFRTLFRLWLRQRDLGRTLAFEQIRVSGSQNLDSLPSCRNRIHF